MTKQLVEEKEEFVANMQIELGMKVQLKAPLQEKNESWDLDVAIKSGKKFITSQKIFKDNLNEFLPILLEANTRLAKPGNPYKSKKGKKVTWNDYCESIGIERRTANNWLAKYRLSIQQKICEEKKNLAAKSNLEESNKDILEPLKPKEPMNNQDAENANNLASIGNKKDEGITDLSSVKAPCPIDNSNNSPNHSNELNDNCSSKSPDETVNNLTNPEIHKIVPISVIKDDEGNLIVEFNCSLCSTKHQVIINKESINA
jgi:hypothetical protein